MQCPRVYGTLHDECFWAVMLFRNAGCSVWQDAVYAGCQMQDTAPQRARCMHAEKSRDHPMVARSSAI